LERHICIHGHFYQPPRENPWLEAIELQESAKPYHDWNKRITAECYAPNATSRILDEQGLILRMVNNYAKINFNFGPTLLVWMEKNAPKVYEAVLEADRVSQASYSGHGSAVAQAYNHMILPLANRSDKETQIQWGIRDFEHRFGRKPEGMWLPETAVDLESLEILAEKGIRFTILSQHQAKRFRPVGEKNWKDVKDVPIDPTQTYALRLPSGRSIALFFFNGAVSRAVAFEGLLSSGEAFVQRLMGGFSEKGAGNQLVHIATDGESYGHHHRFGDMALAYALNVIESKKLAHLTNYGEYLEKNPPAHEVEIFENTSWSCAHGVERWRANCGCHTGSHPEWNQEWRQFLRESLDWLRDAVSPAYEARAGEFFKKPWDARKEYIEVILDRSPASKERFFDRHATRDLTEEERCAALKLLELQRHAMLMYTSCGWFFDDISGIETIQVIQYAARVLQLAQESFGEDLEPAFLERLETAKSNKATEKNGRAIYEKYVRPAKADLKKVAAHYAMSSLFKDYDENVEVYCYKADREDYRVLRAGKATLAVGRAAFTSEITTEGAVMCFAVLHLGDHNMTCGVRRFENEQAYQSMLKQISGAFDGADFPESIRLVDKHFEKALYSLKSLFRNEQSEILGLVLQSSLSQAESIYRQLYENHAPMIRFLTESGSAIPEALQFAAQYVLHGDLHRAFEDEDVDPERVRHLLEAAKTAGMAVKGNGLEFALRNNLERMAERLSEGPLDMERLGRLSAALGVLGELPFQVNIWTVQNACYDLLHTSYPEQRRKADSGDMDANEWVKGFTALCRKTYLKIPSG
jgi:alpha-amylase/alpha-mannosidase (GH57 family)